MEQSTSKHIIHINHLQHFWLGLLYLFLTFSLNTLNTVLTQTPSLIIMCTASPDKPLRVKSKSLRAIDSHLVPVVDHDACDTNTDMKKLKPQIWLNGQSSSPVLSYLCLSFNLPTLNSHVLNDFGGGHFKVFSIVRHDAVKIVRVPGRYPLIAKLDAPVDVEHKARVYRHCCL